MRGGDDLLDLRQVPYSHEHATALTGLAQERYRQIYGGPDTSPLDTDDFTPPRGAFFPLHLGKLLAGE